MAYPVLAPNSTWYKSSTARSTITQINIVDSYTPTGSENESWNADVGNTGSIKCYRSGTILTIAGNGSGKIAMNADSSYVFSDTAKSNLFSNLTKINNANLLNTSNATTFQQLFYKATKLNYIDVSSWNTSNVKNMQGVFCYCISLESVNVGTWDVSAVENMYGMFMGSSSVGSMIIASIGDVSGWNTSKVKTMQAMFQMCSSLRELDVSNWNVSSCENMYGMFRGCTSLEELDVSSWNVSNVTSFRETFYDCFSVKTLDVSNWNTSACINMNHMFNHCTSLTVLDVSNWDVSKVTTMMAIFQDCQFLTVLDVSNWNTGACANMSHMFNDCTSLTSLDVSNWDVSKVTIFSSMFSGTDYGQNPMKIQELDVSKWNTSSATDMSFMFYGCQGCKTLDVYNWNVSKVTTFDHMFAHSYLTVNGIENWAISTAAVNLNCMFHSLKNKTIDVSKFNTSNVQFFCQMFQNSAVSEIIGLENFNTSNGLGFDEMFLNCTNLKELNLSSFDTTKAKDGVKGSANNNHYTTTLMDMFTNMPSLEKITFGEKFSFNGDGTTTNSAHYGILPTPSTAYILNADGNWHTVDGDSYAPNAIPSLTAGTYYADTRASEDYLIKGATLIDIGRAIKKRTNTTNNLTPENMIEAVDSISINASSDSNGNVVLDIAGFLVSEINGNVTVG